MKIRGFAQPSTVRSRKGRNLKWARSFGVAQNQRQRRERTTEKKAKSNEYQSEKFPEENLEVACFRSCWSGSAPSVRSSRASGNGNLRASAASGNPKRRHAVSHPRQHQRESVRHWFGRIPHRQTTTVGSRQYQTHPQRDRS